ncbi:MAG: hypothetical protein ACLQC7_08220 [Thermoplasmata archaeon]
MNEGAAFERQVAQLMTGLLHGIPAGKISWEMLPVGPRAGGSTVEMDWALWLGRTYDYNDAAAGAFLDIEATVHTLEDEPEYVATKILQLRRLIEAPGGIVGAIQRLRGNPKFASFEELGDQPIPYLIFVGNYASRLPAMTSLRPLLRGTKGGLIGSDPSIEGAVGPDGKSIVITLGSGTKLFVGLVNREKLLELIYTAQALTHAERQDEVNERFLHELTQLAARPVLLKPMPRSVEISGVSAPTTISIDGKPATFHRFSIDPFLFLRMSTVLRLVSDYGFLQRLPEGPHLSEMAFDIEAGGRFPTPVLVIPASENFVNVKQSLVAHKGGAVVSPYQWHIIDGQHRAFCYYLVPPGVKVQDLDINCYQLSSPDDRGPVASSLFLNVNFKAIKPPIDLALAHYAYVTQWPEGNWVPRRRGRNQKGDSKLYSARVLASRFLLDLSAGDTVFRGFFKFKGTRDKKKTSIQSISTYLAGDFEIHDPSDPNEPFAARYGTVKGAGGIWIVPYPPPQSFSRLSEALIDSFDGFLAATTSSYGSSRPAAEELLRSLVSKNNNVFVGLWKTFYWYSFKQNASVGAVPEMPKRMTAKLLPWLVKEDSRGHLAGPRNRYRSGSGALAIANSMIKRVGSK